MRTMVHTTVLRTVPSAPIPVGAKRCSRCGRVKPIDQFNRDRNRPDGHRSSCKVCRRYEVAQYRESPSYRARRAEYRTRPEVIERERNRPYRDRSAYYATLRCKLLRSRSWARRQAARAATEERRFHYESMVATCTTLLDRLDRDSFTEVR